MNEIDVNQSLMLDNCIRHIYSGIISSNELSHVKNAYQSLYIVNTDPAYLPGSHWIAIYSDGENCELFDSLGNNPNRYGEYFSRFMNQYKKFTYSTAKLQSDDSNKCGIFCIYYSYYRSRGFDLSQIINALCRDTQINENMMDAFMDCYMRSHVTE